MPSAAEIRALEEVGYRIWVSPEVEELDGWRLRHARGLTGRANSVFPNAAGALPLAEKLDRVEAWYAARGLPARWQLTGGSLPTPLHEALTERGYGCPADPVSVETAVLPPVEPDPRVEVREEADASWVALWASTRGSEDLDTARALLTGSPGRTAFARIEGAAVGRAVAYDGWLGITSMVTLPEARRRGLARAIVASLVDWGRSAGCTRGLLQVESTNEPARALYRDLGFVEQYAYRYWVAP